jgi:hypothetical protein
MLMTHKRNSYSEYINELIRVYVQSRWIEDGKSYLLTDKNDTAMSLLFKHNYPLYALIEYKYIDVRQAYVDNSKRRKEFFSFLKKNWDKKVHITECRKVLEQ